MQKLQRRTETLLREVLLTLATAQGFADLCLYMEILVGDLKVWTKTLSDGVNALQAKPG